MSTSYQWLDLLNPDLTSVHFEAVLTAVLRSTAEVERIQELGEQEFQIVIDVLGQVKPLPIHRSWSSVRSHTTHQYVRTGDVMNGSRKKCFKFLCRICATRGVLPKLYTLKVDDLQRSEVPDYSGGFGEVWRGRYNGTIVAVKKLRGVTASQLEKKKEVRSPAYVMYDNC